MIPSSERVENGVVPASNVPVRHVERKSWRWGHDLWAALIKDRKQGKSLRHIETLTFAAKRSVFLIECDGQRFLVSDGMSAPVPLAQRYAAEGTK